MTAARIIGLVGVTHSGKAIVSRRLLAAGFLCVRFTDPIKAMARQLGIADYQMDTEERDAPIAAFGGKAAGFIVDALSRWGKTSVSPHIWTNLYERRVEGVSGLIVTDDIKRPIEADAVRRQGGAIVRISRPGYPLSSRHSASEIAADVELVNNGTPAQLEKQADAVIEALKGIEL